MDGPASRGPGWGSLRPSVTACFVGSSRAEHGTSAGRGVGGPPSAPIPGSWPVDEGTPLSP